MNFTAWYVFYLENLTVNESMMAYGYELANRTNTQGGGSMQASQKFLVRHTPHTPLLYEGTDSNSHFPSIVCHVAYYGERVSFQLVVAIYA